MTLLRWSPPPPPDPRTVVVSAREADVLTLLARGIPNQQIAARLGVAVGTVASLTNRLYVALGARDRCHAVALVCTGQVAVFVKPEPKRRAG